MCSFLCVASLPSCFTYAFLAVSVPPTSRFELDYDIFSALYSFSFSVYLSPRVCLWDRPPGPGARKLGSASLHKAAPPLPALGNLGMLVTRHMPALGLCDCLRRRG